MWMKTSCNPLLGALHVAEGPRLLTRVMQSTSGQSIDFHYKMHGVNDAISCTEVLQQLLLVEKVSLILCACCIVPQCSIPPNKSF